MINLNHKILAPSKVALRIFKSKSGDNRTILSNISIIVGRRMIDYLSHKRTLHILNRRTYTDKQKGALEHCYDSKTNALVDLKTDMINCINKQNPILLSRCPYCLVREPGTWDHYMPKSKFPEFSVYSPNLIWVCEKCNNMKSNRLVENEKEVIHTYFDKLPDECLLKCDIVVGDPGIPITKFHIPNLDNTSIVDALHKHFVALDLAELYMKESTSYISTLLQEIANRYPGGLSSVTFKEELRIKYCSIPKTWGHNHWQAAVLKGMSECDELIGVIDTLRTKSVNEWERS